MTGANRCPNCGTALPERIAEGLCPRCLMQRALAGDTPGPTPAAGRSPTERDHGVAPTPRDAETLPASTPADATDAWTTETTDGNGASRGLPRGSAVRYFGDYEVRGELGRGGMGVVYEARQVSLNRPVALKMIKAGVLADDAELRRFQNEAEAVATLDHPGIVPVYEVGDHNGQKYFSMKLVAGGNLADRLGAYKDDPRAAAALAAEAAEAVHHAHMRGILHRDLKPANIMVDAEGHPHVTDFGLAKRVEADAEMTASGAVLGTPAYMSPEQAAGRRGTITTATDVYGLGAVLYAVLTGQAPFAGDSVVDTLTKVRERPPEPPRKVNAHVPRDLDTIVLKCLEKDPRRRYLSTHALAEDLRNWLGARPIAARRVGPIERTWLWAHRRPAVAALGLLLACSLVAASLLAIDWGRQQAELARRQTRIAQQQTEAAASEKRLRSEADARRLQAEREAAKAKGVTSFLVDDILAQADPECNARSRRITIEYALDLGGPKVAARFATQPDVELAVRLTIGDTYRALGLPEKAEPHLRRALELSLTLGGEHDPSTLTALNCLATVLQNQDRLDAAEPLFRRLVAAATQAAGPTDQWTLKAQNNLALVLGLRGNLKESEATYRNLLDARTRLQGPRHRGTLMTRYNLANVLRELVGPTAEVERELREVLELQLETLRTENPDTFLTRSALGSTMLARNQAAEAERLHLQNLELRQKVEGREHPSTLNAMNVLAATYRHRGKLAEAEALIRESIQIRRRVQEPTHFDLIAALAILATILQEGGRYAEAEPYFREAHLILREVRGETNLRTLTAASNLGFLLSLRGKLAEAEALFRRTISARDIMLPRDHPNTLQTKDLLANLLLDKGDPAAAEPIARAVAAAQRAKEDPLHRNLPNALDTWGESLVNLGRFKEADPILRESIAIRRQNNRTSHYTTHLLGACLLAAGNLDEAESLLVDGYRRFESSRSFTPPRRRRAADRIVELYMVRGDIAKAGAWRAKRRDLAMPADPFARGN